MKQYFHGGNKASPYFEGWYFKCQTRDRCSLALIPAMHICADGQRSASIQVITENQAWWLEYPATAFTASRDSLRIVIGKNSFSEDGLLLDIEQDGLSVHGRVCFGPFQSLKSDVMGPFRWLANMECAHSVISMKHSLQGQLELNGSVLDLRGGTGYIEADRGRSFPADYLWTQCMWGDCSLMLSVATIPLGKLRFTGCICAIIMNGQAYRIATYRGRKYKTGQARGLSGDRENTCWRCSFWSKRHTLFVRLLRGICAVPYTKACVPRCGIVFGGMISFCLITPTHMPGLSMQTVRPLDCVAPRATVFLTPKTGPKFDRKAACFSKGGSPVSFQLHFN